MVNTSKNMKRRLPGHIARQTDERCCRLVSREKIQCRRGRNATWVDEISAFQMLCMSKAANPELWGKMGEAFVRQWIKKGLI